jgi:hypothetical protein
VPPIGTAVAGGVGTDAAGEPHGEVDGADEPQPATNSATSSATRSSRLTLRTPHLRQHPA